MKLISKKIFGILLIVTVLVLLRGPNLSAQQYNELSQILMEDRIKIALLNAPIVLETDQDKVEKIINLDDIYYITITLEVIPDVVVARLSKDNIRTFKSTVNVKNWLGISLGKLHAYATFQFDGNYATPLDAYGESEITSYSVNISNQTGGKLNKSWAKVTFKGEKTDTGNHFNKTCMLYCDANGKGTASWNTD